MTFHDLHAQPGPLLLPNAWDVASALAFVDAGFAAVGTTSFGIGAARGEPDGGRSSRDATRELVHRLTRLPVPAPLVTSTMLPAWLSSASTVTRARLAR